MVQTTDNEKEEKISCLIIHCSLTFVFSFLSSSSALINIVEMILFSLLSTEFTMDEQNRTVTITNSENLWISLKYTNLVLLLSIHT